MNADQHTSRMSSPTRAPRSGGAVRPDLLGSVILLVIAGALIAGGVFLLVQRESGTREKATVTRWTLWR